ncbi:MAG: hypothetical protein GY865_01805 [candidate division Zixibacteria bacterium]|nr:hypothetical protein [candidate division Zixibacteria bacterium]
MPRSLNIGLFIIILFLIILRFVSLEIDPPLFFAGFTQAHLTDPYHLTFFARNAILFDDSNPFDFYRWDVFKYSLISGFSYIVFSIGGVSKVSANISAVFLNLTGLFLFVFGAYRLRSNSELYIKSVLLLLSSMLFFYGRLPFLENGLIFLSGLLFCLFLRTYDKWWGQLLSGFLVALAALSGKLFGFVLLGPIIISLIYRYRSRVFIPSILVFAGCVIGVISYVALFFGESAHVLKNYYLEQTIGMYGTHLGFTAPLILLKKLLTYGGTNGFFGFSPFFVVISGLGLILFLLRDLTNGKFNKDSLPIIFSIAWIICGILGLMPFNYRPLRYAIFLFLPISALGAYGINLLSKNKITFQAHYKIMTSIVLLFICWYILTQVVITLTLSAQMREFGIAALPYTLIISILLSAAVFFWLKKGPLIVSRNKLIILIAPLLIGMMVHQGMLLYKGMVQPGKYLMDYNKEMYQLIDEESVLSGPYAPALTIGNNLKGIIYHFGLTDIEHSLFDKYPISHIVVDRSNWDQAKRDFPNLKKSIELALYTIRDSPGKLFRLPNARVPLTDYEKGKIFLEREMPDSSLIYSKKFNSKYPKNLFGLFLLVESYQTANQLEPCFELLNTIVKANSENYRVHLFCKIFYNDIFKKIGNTDFQKMSRYHYEQALKLNPALQ